MSPLSCLRERPYAGLVRDTTVAVSVSGGVLNEKTLAASGLHSNGFSLVRHVIQEAGISYFDDAPFRSGTTLAEALLEPTQIYVKSTLAAIATGGVHGMAHITGGGLLENIPRVLPEGLGADLNASAWKLPEVFQWLAKAGKIDQKEMARTFNCGIGLSLIHI